MPSRRHNSEMFSSPRRPSSTMRTFSSSGGVHRYASWRRMSFSTCSAALRCRWISGSTSDDVFCRGPDRRRYGPYDRAIRENDVTRPTTLYGVAKLAAGLMAARLCEERRMRFAWLRIFSTYGPKDADYWLIPSMIRTLRSGAHMALTPCEQRWGFLHARDAATAVRLVLTSPSAEGTYNLGSPDAPPLRLTVMTLRDLIDPDATLGFGEVSYRRDQTMVLAADTGRLAALGWCPEVRLDEGLRETLAWYDAADVGDRP